MKPRATLVTFAVGAIFERYAEALLASAAERFFPGRAQYLVLESTPRWPDVIRDRHRVILQERRRVRGEFVFLLDADLLFEGPVDDEIVPDDGITACLHPVQNELPVEKMTYERNPASSAYVPVGEGGRYYLGGIVGGTRGAFLELSATLDRMFAADGDYCAVWQDESYLNRVLIDAPPALELDNRYCAWPNHQIDDVRIRALDKTPQEFAERNRLGH